MKYDIDVDPGEGNTSHGVIVNMVGTGKQVLDVGCSTGYLGRLLKDRGNTVVGLEIDAEAAAQAEQVLDRVVVGDLERMDLGEAIGSYTFDIVVMADVLEHLVDPLKVLKQAVALLSPGGSVIVSIPNVAHGAVRLSLLEGRFEYHPLGLLDDTHVRFFTRSSVDELLRAAGLVATERRRTTADLFGTEIALDARAFSEDVIDEVRADPDSSTYQFVVRAVPVDEGESVRTLATDLVAVDGQLEALRAQVEALVRGAAAETGRGPSAGLVSAVARKSGWAVQALRAATVTAEMRRRLTGFAIRTYASDSSEASFTWTGEPMHPLLPWTSSRAAELASSLDAMLVCGDPPPEHLVSGLAQEGCATFWSGVIADTFSPPTSAPATTSGGTQILIGRPPDDPPAPGRVRFVPDPLLLAGRLHSPGALDQRLSYLRLLGQVPASGPFLLVGFEEIPETAAAAVARSLDELARRASAVLVLVGGAQQDQPALGDRLQAEHLVFESEDPIDLLALTAGAEGVVTDSAGLLALALGLRRPCHALSEARPKALVELAEWLGDPDVIVDRPAALLAGESLALARSKDQQSFDRLADTLDLAFDELAADVRGSLGRRAAVSVPLRLKELAERVATLEAANAGLQQRMAAERAAFAHQAQELMAGDGSARLRVDDTTAAAAQLQVLRLKYEHLEQELAAVYATKTMRALKPARETYRRLRTMWR